MGPAGIREGDSADRLDCLKDLRRGDSCMLLKNDLRWVSPRATIGLHEGLRGAYALTTCRLGPQA
jgi:hypothetical protein